jgi:hypothetical protein
MNLKEPIDKMNIIIFSKDRAAQLDLLLRSMKRMFPESHKSRDIHVLYTYSDEAFGAGYVRTITMHPDIHYAYENKGKFKEDLLKLISKDRYFTMFFVDDNVFKNPFNIGCEEVKEFVHREDIACVSLRLCPRIDYCYTMNVPMAVPTFPESNRLIWTWSQASPGDWSYPMSLDGHLFKTKEILPLLNLLNYSNPNTLEGNLANSPFNIPRMICFEDSKIFNIPANKVQNVNGNRHGNYSATDINEQFMRGKRFSLEKILNNPAAIKNTSCHQDIPLEWEWI